MKNTSYNKILLLLPLLIIVIIGAVLYIKNSSSESTIKESYEKTLLEADASYETREYSEAYSQYQAAVEKDPSRPEAYVGLISILLDKGIIDKAEELAKVSEKNLSSNNVATLYLAIGDKYYEIEDYSNAVKAYTKAKDFSDDSIIKLALFKGYLKTGELDKAEEMVKDLDDTDEKRLFETYSTIISDSERSLYEVVDQANVYVNQGYPHLAIKLIQSRSEQAIEYWDAWYIQGKAYFDVKQYNEASKSLEQALSLGSEEPGIYLLLARIAYFESQVNSSYTYYDRAFLLAEGEFREQIGEEYGQILLRQGVTSKAIELANSQVDESVDANKRIWRTHLLLKAYIQQDNVALIDELVAAASVEVGSEYEFQKTLAEYYLDKEMVDLAETQIAQLKVKDQYDPTFYFFQGRLNLLKDNNDDARINLEKALEYDVSGEVSSGAKILLEELQSF